jgi:hypothetical protein
MHQLIDTMPQLMRLGYVDTGRKSVVSKNQRPGSRKPATKFAHLRKKMQQQRPAKTLRKGK